MCGRVCWNDDGGDVLGIGDVRGIEGRLYAALLLVEN